MCQMGLMNAAATSATTGATYNVTTSYSRLINVTYNSAKLNIYVYPQSYYDKHYYDSIDI